MRLKFRQAIWPITLIVIVLATILWLFATWNNPSGIPEKDAAYQSGYKIGMLVGGLFFGLFIPLGGAFITHLLSRSIKYPTNLVGLLFAGLVVLASLGALVSGGASHRGNEQVLREMANEMKDYKARLGVALETEDAEAAQRLEEESLEILRRASQNATGPLRAYLGRVLEFREGLNDVVASYDEAVLPVSNAEFYDTRNVTKSQLEDRIEVVKKWSLVNRELLDTFAGAETLLKDRSMLKHRFEKEFVGGMVTEIARTSDIVRDVRVEDEIVAGLLKEAFELYLQEWDNVQGGEGLDSWEFDDSASEERRLEIINEIDLAAERQTEAQMRLVR